MPGGPNPTDDDVERLRAPFEAQRPMTIGLEEELMLLDPESLDMAPRAPELLARLDGDARFRKELPAAQIEIVGPVCGTVAAAAAALRAARHDLVRAADNDLAFAGAGVHPFAAANGVLNDGEERYADLIAEYGPVARRQLVFGLHIHVAVSGADRALAVFNALRAELPALAALGAGSPFYEGHDTGLASVRPKICDLLPRQGVPPAIPSWEALAEVFAWGVTTGRFGAAQWWWEARLHPIHGTIEIRVPDAQATIGETAAIAAVGHALVATLAARHEAGETLDAPPSYRIGENRWSACRHGVEGDWADPETGAVTPMREHLHALIDELRPAAAALGCAAELETARDLIERPRATLARAIAAERGIGGHVADLAGRFLG